jgi:hypothetical protein
MVKEPVASWKYADARLWSGIEKVYCIPAETSSVDFSEQNQKQNTCCEKSKKQHLKNPRKTLKKTKKSNTDNNTNKRKKWLSCAM